MTVYQTSPVIVPELINFKAGGAVPLYNLTNIIRGIEIELTTRKYWFWLCTIPTQNYSLVEC